MRGFHAPHFSTSVAERNRACTPHRKLESFQLTKIYSFFSLFRKENVPHQTIEPCASWKIRTSFLSLTGGEKRRTKFPLYHGILSFAQTHPESFDAMNKFGQTNYSTFSFLHDLVETLKNLAFFVL